MSIRIYAHSLTGRLQSDWEPLEDHLRAVAGRAAEFASVFSCGGLAELAGVWHDLGKASEAFQKMLHDANGIVAHIEDETKPRRIDHSTAGAQYADKVLPEPIGKLLAYIIAGHHTGLANWDGQSDSALRRRLSKDVEPYDPSFASLIQVDPAKLSLSGWRPPADGSLFPFQLAFLTRMLFSTLVDADWIETERFCDPDAAAVRGRRTWACRG